MKPQGIRLGSLDLNLIMISFFIFITLSISNLSVNLVDWLDLMFSES